MAINKNDDNLNPGQTHSDELMNSAMDLNKAEKVGNNLNNNSDVNNAEKNPEANPGWNNKFTGKSNKEKSGGRFKFVKKKGPIIGIVLTLVGGGIGIGGLLSPSLLVVHMKEVLVNKFNAQQASMDIRTTKMLKTKTISGSCGTIKILCKFKSMSDRQIANFKKAGIEVVGEKNTFGRTKPTSFKFEGGDITSYEFNQKIVTGTKFRSAVKNAYNPKFAGLTDKIWSKTAGFLGITKKATDLSGVDDKEKLKKIQEDIKTGAAPDIEITTEQKNPATGENYTQDEVDMHNNAITEALGEATDGGTKSAAKKILEPITNNRGFAYTINAVKITGSIDAACLGYTTMLNIGKAAKVVRALQLARYAMIFLNVADSIKAGDATEEDVSYAGKVLTTLTLAEDGNMKSATDSFGYKYSAFNDNGKMPTSSSRFLAGGGLTGKLLGLKTTIKKPFGKRDPTTVCNFLSNPFVQRTSFIIGGAALLAGLFPPLGTYDVIKIGLVTALTLATAFLPALLDDIIAGVLVDDTTVGEDAGDAITSGASGIMSTTAHFGGNAPLTPEQAVKYDSIKEDIAVKYAEEDRMAHSPFDATNSNTFMGKITIWLTPYLSKISSLPNIISSIASIVTKSFSFILPQNVKATPTNIESYQYCQDDDYLVLRIATDPFCNITYGIPGVENSPDPVVIAEKLLNFVDPADNISRPLIDSETGEPSDSGYVNFVNNCINRTDPFVKSTVYKAGGGRGATEPTGRELVSSGETGASECMYNESSDIKTTTTTWCSGQAEPDPGDPGSGWVYINTKIEEDGLCSEKPRIIRYKKTYYYLGNSYLYIHFIDQRVESGMDGI